MSYFLQLFARGRYVTSRSIARKEATSEDPQRRHEERERFAVAAIAFCLEHDSRFEAYFLNLVGASKKVSIKLIEVEPKRWGDLVLEGPKNVLVLEFKIDALLAEHQDPGKPLFERAGYGAQIRARYPSKSVEYVVIGRPVKAGRTKDGLQFRGLSWSRLLHPGCNESQLERDLYDCLGVLGARIFLSRDMTKRSLTHEAAAAMRVYKLLVNAAEAAGDIPTSDSESAIDHIGVNLSASRVVGGSAHEKLRDFIQPTGRSLGWIGYEKLEELCLSVWFYSSKRQAGLVRKKLDMSKLGTVDEDGTSVGIRRPAIKEADHVRWISQVLKVAMDH